MPQSTKGVIAMAFAALVWGLSPLYYAQLAHIPPAEVLAHRTLWSVVIFSAVILLTRRGAETMRVITTPRLLAWIGAAGVMIATNWYVFIYSVAAGRVTESSLGYYFFPLVMVLLGQAVFKERLNMLQWVAVGFGLVAALVLTIGLGAPPWLALIIAGTFGFYGMVKKQVAADPIVSVTIEVLVLLPIALLYIALWGTVVDGASLGLLVFSGIITAGPLMLMTYATRVVRMATVGLIQYTNPMVQYFCAIVILGEIITGWHVAALAAIAVALTLYSLSAFQADRKMPTTS